MPEDDVSVTDQRGGPDADKTNPLEARVTALEKDLAAKDRRIAELSESEGYWHGQAEAFTKSKPDAKDDDDAEPETEEAVIDDSADEAVDAFSTEGIAALVKRGVLTKKLARDLIAKEARRAAKELVDVEVGKLHRQRQHDQADAEMVGKYPDLNDDQSPLFKRTGEIFREQTQADPILKRSPGALMMAARVAKAELVAEARVNGKDANERDRVDRINGQAGGAGTRGFDGNESDDKLSPGQKSIIDKFNAQGGVQIKEESYMKRAKEGIRMSTRAAMPDADKRREVGDW